MNAGVEMKEINQQEDKIETRKQNEKIRVQFDFSKESLSNLDKLVEVFSASSRAEVVRRALTLLTDALDEKENGGKLGFKKNDGSFETIRFY